MMYERNGLIKNDMERLGLDCEFDDDTALILLVDAGEYSTRFG